MSDLKDKENEGQYGLLEKLTIKVNMLDNYILEFIWEKYMLPKLLVI